MKTLKEFLKEVKWKEEDIISYEWEEALKAVKQDWYALRYINNQTEEICLEAVKEDWDALKYVDNQTEEICLEAVKQNWYALQYVDKSIFKKEIISSSFQPTFFKNSFNVFIVF